MSLAAVITKTLFLDTIRSIVYFPVWWYSHGLKKRFLGFISGLGALSHNLGLKIMFKYLFKPMFGERSRSGRIISFFMRLILLFWRLFLFLLGAGGRLLLFVLWVVLPIIALWQIIIRLLS